MPKFLIKGNYIGEGINGLMDEGGTSRREAVEQLISSLGGSMEALYFAFGDTDVFVIADMPDNASAAAASLVANAAGTVSASLTVLLTPEEMDQATEASPTYRAPGR